MNRLTDDAAKGGFTLIELVVTIVILGFSLAMMAPFFQAIEHSPDPIVRDRTVSLAQALMDEILSTRWDENTPAGGGPICSGESGAGGRGASVYGAPLDCNNPGGRVASAIGADGATSRLAYDDVDDYNAMAMESDTFYDSAGVAFVYKGYTRSVQVDYVASGSGVVDGNTPSATGTTDTKRIRVRVTNPLGENYVLVALSCNF